MDTWMVKPNLQLQSVKFEDKRFEEKLLKIQRKLYLFEAKDMTQPSKNLVHFLGRCVECLGPNEGDTSKR
jgi:hypothetical protein